MDRVRPACVIAQATRSLARISFLHSPSDLISSPRWLPAPLTDILVNPGACQSIVDKANLRQTDKVLEVGPGTGNLSALILQQCKSMLAVEMDPRMAAELQKRVQGKPEQRKLDIIVGDFIKTDLPYFDVCISNTPYQVRRRSPLLVRAVESQRAQERGR